MESRLPRPQAARLVETLREHFWPGLRYVVGASGHGRTDLLQQSYLLQCKDLTGPVPIWLRPGARPESEQLVAQLLEYRAGCLRTPFLELDPSPLDLQPDQSALRQLLVSSGNNSPERFFAAVGGWLSGAKDLKLCLYLDDAPDAWLATAVTVFGVPLAILASGPVERAPRGAELIRLEELSTREAVLLGEAVARSAGVPYRGEAAEGFCAHAGRNPRRIAGAVRAAANEGRVLETEADFADAALADLAAAAPAPPQSVARALEHSTLLAGFAEARRREEQARVNQRVTAGLARVTPACETWLAEQGISGARVPVVTSVACEDLASGTLLLAFGGGVFGGQEMLAAALLEPATPGHYRAALSQFQTRVAALAPPPATLFDPRWEHVERWVIFRQPPEDAVDLAAAAGARLLPFDVFERLVVGQGTPETYPEQPETVLRLPLDRDFEIPAVHALDHLLDRRGVDKRPAAKIRMALVEACLNAIHHGRASSPEDAFMEVRLAVGPHLVRITVSNPGLPKSPLGASLLRGHGRKILDSLMDSVQYDCNLNRTRVVLTKQIAGTVDRAEHEPAPTGGQRG